MIGSISLGLVWGWLLLLVSGRTHTSLSSLGKLSAATVITSVEVKFFSGTAGLLAFLITTAAALLMHQGWMQQLKLRRRISG